MYLAGNHPGLLCLGLHGLVYVAFFALGVHRCVAPVILWMSVIGGGGDCRLGGLRLGLLTPQ
jgi:hypothetical protein